MTTPEGERHYLDVIARLRAEIVMLERTVEELQHRARPVARRTGLHARGDGSRFTLSKRAAEVRGKIWTLSKDTYDDLVSRPCHYCGAELKATGIGLDRIDNARGYELDNVLPCCWPCNLLRGSRLSVAETELILRTRRERVVPTPLRSIP